MNISEKAKAYAEGKAVSALTSAIEAAYAEGYNAGFADGLASKEGEKPDDLKDDGVEYVDLGLPSGTKWAAGFLRNEEDDVVYLPYSDAAQLKIPSKEDIEEIVNYCKIDVLKRMVACNGGFSVKSYGISILGPNGNYIKFDNNKYSEAGVLHETDDVWVWVKNEEVEGTNREFVKLGECGYGNLFMGTCIPVILVR